MSAATHAHRSSQIILPAVLRRQNVCRRGAGKVIQDVNLSVILIDSSREIPKPKTGTTKEVKNRHTSSACAFKISIKYCAPGTSAWWNIRIAFFLYQLFKPLELCSPKLISIDQTFCQMQSIRLRARNLTVCNRFDLGTRFDSTTRFDLEHQN